MSEPWFSVRCVFKKDDTYEERITLWLARDFDEAIALAEAEAREYAETLDLEYLGLAQAFHLFDADVRSGVEVFSLVRESASEAEAYLSAFFDTGLEFQRDAGERAFLPGCNAGSGHLGQSGTYAVGFERTVALRTLAVERPPSPGHRGQSGSDIRGRCYGALRRSRLDERCALSRTVAEQPDARSALPAA